MASNLTQQLAEHVTRGTHDRIIEQRKSLLAEFTRGYDAGYRAALADTRDAEQRARQAQHQNQTDVALANIDGLLFGQPGTVKFGPAVGTLKARYTLHVEHVPGVDYTGIVANFFNGATIQNGIGLDSRAKDGKEYATIITIVTSATDHVARVTALAEALRSAAEQASVLIVRDDVRTTEVVR